MSASELDVEELALRVLMASFEGPVLPDEWGALVAEGLGGICLFGSNLRGPMADVADLIATCRTGRPDLLVATDEEGGDVTRLHVRDVSPVPGAAVLGAFDDTSLTRAVGRAIGAELAAIGIDMDLGTVADVNCNPDNPVIGTRSFGAAAGVVARHAFAWVEGLQSAGVAACVKHYPGHGDTAEDSHLALPVVDVPLDVLTRRELVPFDTVASAGAASIMTSHIVVPALDTELPATLSPAVLALLRKEYDGAIVSDALDMAGASAARGIPEAAVLALIAGCDLLCVGPDKSAGLVREIQAAIVAAVGEGRLPIDRLQEAAARVGRIRRSSYASSGVVAPLAEADVARFRTAARAALIIEGAVPDLSGAVVVSVETTANIAVGEGRWGLVPDVVVAAGERLPSVPLVVQVRDAHRRPDVAAMLAQLDERSVVVEWGWPGPRAGWAGSAATRICTHGNSRPSIAAVEDVLAEGGWSR